MSQRQFNHLPDLRHLFPATSDIVVTNVIKFLLIFSVDRFAFCVEHSAGSYDSELLGLSCNYFELNGFEAASDDEEVSLFDRTIGILEIRYQVSFGEIALYALGGV